MSDRVIAPGDKLHVITRRLFLDDIRRHFAGEVMQVDRDLCELQGYIFVYHSGTNDYTRRPELRNRIISCSDAVHIINKLPREVDIESLEYKFVDKRLVVTDTREFALDIHEFGPNA